MARRLLVATVTMVLALTGAGVLPAAAHSPAMAASAPGAHAAGAVPAALTASRGLLASSPLPAAPVPTVAIARDLDGVTSWSIDLDARRGTTTSREIRTDPFTLAAVSWDRSGPQPERLELRVREGARWGEWFELVVDETDAPDGRFATEPFIADGASRLQARTVAETAPSGLRVDLVHVADDVPRTGLVRTARQSSTVLQASTATLPGVREAASATRTSVTGNELRPKIISRKAWGANERKSKDVSSSTWLKAMYVHHTAGPNSYSKSRARAVVRGIWAFHTSGRGWPDIGYQFLVDRFGTIYEGRRGAISGLPVGAQAGGYNADTIGVSVMGNHTSVNPSQRVVNAVVDVLAWQAHRYGVDPRGKVRLRTATSTGSKTRWAYGRWTPRLPVIRGPRDTNHTACPGARLYAKLPAIRRAVDAKVKAAVRAHGAPPAQLRAPRAEKLRPQDDGVTLSATVRLTWREVSGARRYEVVKRTAKHGRAVAQTKYAWKVESTTKGTKAKVKVPRGQTWTLGVRAVDALGRPGKVRRIGTTTRPVSVKRIDRSGRWSIAKRAEYLGGTAFVSRERGARLTIDRAKQVRSVWLVAPTGPNRGRVAVSIGGKRVAVVSLARASHDPRGLVEVRLPKKRTGVVEIRAMGSRSVRISGVILERGHL